MNHDEFAFFNQQLAAMLKEGIPLEGALKQLSAGMRQGPLRLEIQLLDEDLARGTPLKDALARRSLPELYRRMLELGVRSNDLPGVLTLLADHYQRAHALWTRLKGLLVYPLIVVTVSLSLTLALSVALTKFTNDMLGELANMQATMMFGTIGGPPAALAAVWAPPVMLALLAAVGAAAVAVPRWRAQLRWQLPAFREASLAELASALALVLRNGTTLAEALALAETLEASSPADRILTQWRSLVETGQGKPSQWPFLSRPIPPLFLWLVRQGGEDVAAGFQKAADIYYARAVYRIDLMLYGALPISIFLVGLMVFCQAAPLVRGFIWTMDTLGR